MRSILMAFPEGTVSRKIRQILQSGGLEITAHVSSEPELLQLTAMLEGGGVILSPAKLSGRPAAMLTDNLPEDYDLLLLLDGDQDWDSSRAGVFALRAPIRPGELINSVRMLLETRQMVSTARPYMPDSTVGRAKKPIKARPKEEMDIINQAKELLMTRNNMSEEQAHRFLQKRSMDSCQPMLDVAREVLSE